MLGDQAPLSEFVALKKEYGGLSAPGRGPFTGGPG